MKNMKDLSNSVLNQAKYMQDNLKDNVVSFQKKVIQQNPMNSMQTHWQIAQMRKNFVFLCTLPFVIGQCYWDTWQNVYNPEGKK